MAGFRLRSVHALIAAVVIGFVVCIWIWFQALSEEARFLLISIVVLVVTIVVMWVGDFETTRKIDAVAAKLGEVADRISSVGTKLDGVTGKVGEVARDIGTVADDVKQRAALRPVVTASFILNTGELGTTLAIVRDKQTEITIALENQGPGPAMKAIWSLFFPPWLDVRHSEDHAGRAPQSDADTYSNYTGYIFPKGKSLEMATPWDRCEELHFLVTAKPEAPPEGKIVVNGDCAETPRKITDLHLLVTASASA